MIVLPPNPIPAADAWEQAYKESVVQSLSDQSRFLLETVGPRVTAAALGLRDARQVRRWSDEGGEPREQVVSARLPVLFRITFALAAVYGGAAAALFLRSANPQLDDEAPLLVLRASEGDEGHRAVLAAARAFLEG